MTLPVIQWSPLYAGVDHATGTNGGTAAQPGNVNLLRVDLHNPAIRFLTTPLASLNPSGVRTTDFLTAHFDAQTMQAMVAVNANFFDMDQGMRNRAYGLVVSQGAMVMLPYSAQSPCGLIITQDNQALLGTPESFDYAVGHTVLAQPWTAVAGSLSLVQGGQSVAPSPTSTAVASPMIAARTAVGLSQPPAGGTAQYLYLVTIDGIEPKPEPKTLPATYYGATLQDAATWLLAAGAYNAFNLDGGGSTTMAQISQQDPTAQLMNTPYDNEEAPSVERYVAVSFAIISGT